MFGKKTNPNLEPLTGVDECIGDGAEDAFPSEVSIPRTARYAAGGARCASAIFGPILPRAVQSSAVATGFKYGPAFEGGRRFVCGISSYPAATPSELVSGLSYNAAILEAAGEKVRFCATHMAAVEFFRKLGVRRIRPVWSEFTTEALAVSAALLIDEIQKRLWIFPSKDNQVRPAINVALEDLARFDATQPISSELMSLLVLAEVLRRRPTEPLTRWYDSNFRLHIGTEREKIQWEEDTKAAMLEEQRHRREHAAKADLEQARRFGAALQREWNIEETEAQRRAQQAQAPALEPVPEPVAEPAAPTPEAQPEPDLTAAEFEEIVLGKRPIPKPTEE